MKGNNGPMSALPYASFNTLETIQKAARAGTVSWRSPAVMLVSRLVLFGAFQAVFAAIFALAGQAQPWERAAAWWPYTATFTNLVTFAALYFLFRREGGSLFSLYKFNRGTVARDLLTNLALFVIAAPVSMLPNTFLANLLLGGSDAAGALFFRPLPLWAVAVSLVAFPVSNCLVELPMYYAYSMPRLETWLGSTAAILLAAFFHAAQHISLPLIFNWSYLGWRLGMFIPFALMSAIIFHWRPRLLPYMLVIHGLMDFSLVFMLLSSAVK
jgi:hypothetical protein